MSSSQPLTANKKLKVIFRIEPGCLGPDGKSLIDNFCHFAQPHIDLPCTSKLTSWTDLISCQLTPRHDKSLPELQYIIDTKTLSREKATRYCAMLNKCLDDFEDALNEKLSDLIDTYLTDKTSS
ncbi:MAG TPA: hypothetical protein ENJ08_03580 [Gammaproteobacteria bacterium]|nr:hypothetical protein [Gammaproteobacteria bacterium]